MQIYGHVLLRGLSYRLVFILCRCMCTIIAVSAIAPQRRWALTTFVFDPVQVLEQNERGGCLLHGGLRYVHKC